MTETARIPPGAPTNSEHRSAWQPTPKWRERARETLRRFWADSLRLEAADVTDATDFFGQVHGADSMDAVYLETRIAARFQVDLPDFAVIEAPTPAEMADLVGEQLALNPPRHAPLLGPERRHFAAGTPGAPMLYFAPGAMAGSGPSVSWLARQFPREWGVAALLAGPSPADGAMTPAAWFDSVIRAWTGALVADNPAGPWRLMADCGTAPLAWETARVLSRRGNTSILLLDPWMHAPPQGDLAGDDAPGGRPAMSVRDRALTGHHLEPDDLDLTLLLTPSWPMRESAERYADLVPGGCPILYLPNDTAGHSITARSIGAIAAEVRHWLITRDGRASASVED